MNDSLPDHDIVLLGAGHTHAHILRMWRMDPIPRARLTCVSDHSVATYSGMLAGTLAGQYESSDMEIDLVRLCASCGVRFVQAKAIGLNVSDRSLLLKDRSPMKYDLLSVGIGSRPTIPHGGDRGLSIKPMQTFLQRLKTSINEALAKRSGETVRIAVVGGGAAGVEIACCLHEFLKQHKFLSQKGTQKTQLSITLVEASGQLLRDMPLRARKLAIQELQRRGIRLQLNSRITRVEKDQQLIFEEGQKLAADIVLWATSAQPPVLLDKLGLPLDERGFLRTHSTLQSTGSDEVFAVGDAGAVDGEQYAKAGVFAVREGPVLWENLRRKILGQPLWTWHPQSQFLSLIRTGDNLAILTYRGFSFHAKWCWQLKDWIDTRFMAKYQQYDPSETMHTTSGTSEENDLAKQCGGCGCKTSARVLQRSLPALNQTSYDHVLMGLDTPDDVALLAPRAGRATAVSTDFFTAFVDDPFLMGRIAALNALSDLYAKGATPQAALSMVILPPGSEEQQSNLLNALLAGAVREFGPAGVPIVGGHSIVGPKLTVGFTVLGDVDAESVLRKKALSLGNFLVLTKPIGTGVLLAAHMQAACRAEWWMPLIDTMLRGNREAATVAAEVGVSASTDVTGFGLAGHLLEMLSSTCLTAEISLQALPVLPGAVELLEGGFESTLAPSNRECCRSLQCLPQLQSQAATKLLYDPQTSGGLLLAVPENHIDELISKLGSPAKIIGRIVESDGNLSERISLLP